MAKKPRLTVFDIGRIAKTPTPTIVETGDDGPRVGENLPAYQARLAREEKERQAIPLKKAQSELNTELQKNAKDVARFFSQPTETILKAELRYYPTDFGLSNDFPERTDEENVDAYSALFNEFAEGCFARGFEMSSEGWTRLFRYSKFQSVSRNFALTPAFLQACLERLAELNCFPSDEILKGELPKRQEIQKPGISEADLKRTTDALLEQARSDSPIWKKAVDQEWSAEFVQWFYAWVESLKQYFDYDFPEHLNSKVGFFFKKWNLPYWQHSSWHKLRLALVKSGNFPETMWGPEERLNQLIENSDTNNYHTRRELGRVAQELRNGHLNSLPYHK